MKHLSYFLALLAIGTFALVGVLLAYTTGITLIESSRGRGQLAVR